MHCETTSVPGVMTAAMMKMISTAYLKYRMRKPRGDEAHAREEEHERRHLEDHAECQQHLHVQARTPGSIFGMNSM